MRERSYRFSEKQAEEHRLEIENRIRNLFWTISGDYTLDVKPDVKAFVRSRSAVLYDAMKQGAFARYFNSEELALYMDMPVEEVEDLLKLAGETPNDEAEKEA